MLDFSVNNNNDNNDNNVKFCDKIFIFLENLN